jgi:hypothetical protein
MRLYRHAARALTAVPEARRNEIAMGGLRRKGTTMTRTNALRLWLTAGLIAAVAAIPAMASGGYESVNATTGPTQSSDGDRGFESVNAIAGPVPSSDDRSYESINAVAGPVSDQPSSLVSDGRGYSSLNALVGDEPTPLVELREPDGFDWGDALTGALGGAALMLLAFGGARLVGRSRRRTAESSA